MAEFGKVEYKFPDEREPEKSAAEGDEIEIEVIDDTPEPDKGRKPLDEPVSEVTDDELSKYDEGVQKRIKKLSHGYHDERRAKEAALREREEALKFAQQIIEENKRLKTDLNSNNTLLVGTAKQNAELALDQARKKYKEAYESGDSDRLVSAQEELTAARIKLERVNNFKPTRQEPEKEVHIEAPRVDPKAEAWKKDNPWFGSDDEMTGFVLVYHSKLIKQGVDASSDEYYEKLNTRRRQMCNR